MLTPMPDYVRVLLRRALSRHDPALLQVSFEAAVLDRYRGQAAYSVIRTDSAGRVRKQGGWALDFGIAPGEASIHASWKALDAVLPAEEQEHWAQHCIEGAALSENFLRMQLAPGSCFDDGDVRTW
jgi:hypothetical protein